MVERKLPLLANKADSGHEIVQMNIISQENIDGMESEPTHQIVELNIVSQPVSAAPTENFVVGKSVEAEGRLLAKHNYRMKITFFLRGKYQFGCKCYYSLQYCRSTKH